MLIFALGSCRILTTLNFATLALTEESQSKLFEEKITPIYTYEPKRIFINNNEIILQNGYNNFLGLTYNTRQHIQFIKFIKDEINFPENILYKCLINISHEEIENRKNILKKQFDTCEWYIFEISSLKLYNSNDQEIGIYELNIKNNENHQLSAILTEEELYTDLYTIRSLIPKDKKILFQTHFRLQIIYDNDNIINNREIIYNVVNKFCKDNENTYIYDPSVLLKTNLEYIHDDFHFSTKGYYASMEYIYNTYLSKI